MNYDDMTATHLEEFEMLVQGGLRTIHSNYKRKMDGREDEFLVPQRMQLHGLAMPKLQFYLGKTGKDGEQCGVAGIAYYRGDTLFGEFGFEPKDPERFSAFVIHMSGFVDGSKPLRESPIMMAYFKGMWMRLKPNTRDIHSGPWCHPKDLEMYGYVEEISTQNIRPLICMPTEARAMAA